jgi:hypothetical protein
MSLQHSDQYRHPRQQTISEAKNYNLKECRIDHSDLSKRLELLGLSHLKSGFSMLIRFGDLSTATQKLVADRHIIEDGSAVQRFEHISRIDISTCVNV